MVSLLATAPPARAARRRWIPGALAALVLSSTASLGHGQLGETGPDIDKTPSDPAALGFLRNYVDATLYTLAGANAEQVSAEVAVQFEPQGRPPIQLDFTAQQNLGDGEPPQVALAGPQPFGIGKNELDILMVDLVPTAFTVPPSISADLNFVVRLSTDGEFIRLDKKPRSEGGLSLSEWYTEDGLLVRSRRQVPLDFQGQDAFEEKEYTFGQVHGKTVLLRDVAKVGEVQITTTYEYGKVGRYVALKQFRTEMPGMVRTVQYRKVAISPDR